MFYFSRYPQTEFRPWACSSSEFSTASSSISVVSVPFDVTGEGPTISLLGLIRWAEPGLMKELGRRAWESDPEELLLWQCTGQLHPSSKSDLVSWESYAMYWEGRAGDSGPVGSDMSACAEYLEAMLPVDDLKGASRAIALGYR